MHIKNYRFLASIIAAWTLAHVEAQTVPPVPRLVVNVIVDQLRSDYMEAFSPLYGERGFKRLLKEARVYSQAEYPFSNPDRASAVACLFTGTSPYNNGIVGETWMDRATLRPLYCVEDKAHAGLLTTEGSSPRHLAVSTIGDELKVATEGKALVYAISPYRDAAVLSAGHAANGAFWINDLTGQWCGTSYYGDYPSWAVAYDRYYSLGKRISSIDWQPVNDLVGNFSYFVSGGMRKPFKHNFSGDRKFRQFKASGCVNEEVNRFVKHCLTNTTIGVDAITDLLSVTYYAGNFEHNTVTESPIELQDTYVRLDRDLGQLIDDIENKVGADRVLFVITSTGYADQETADLSKYRIPTGDFSINKASALLNMYLMAIYGPGQYVETVHGSQLYLNHKYIEEKQISLTQVMDRSQEFLIQMSGVKDVYTSQRLTLGAWTPGISRIRNSFSPKCSGDIFIEVASGWKLVNEETRTSMLVRESYVGFPLFFLGCNVPLETIKTPVTIDCVAPTVAQFMRIRAPNACSLAPLSGIR